MEAKGQAIPSQGNPSISANGAVAGNGTSRTRADFEGLLGLAEKLQASLEKHTDDRRRLRVTQQCVAFLMWIEVAFGYFFTITRIPSTYSFDHPLPSQVTVALALVAACLIASAWCLYSSLQEFRDLRHAIQMDGRGLTEIVELLREIEPVVAREEDWSVLERLQIRIRLSRFGIGASWRDGEGPASRASSASFDAGKSRVDQELTKPLR